MREGQEERDGLLLTDPVGGDYRVEASADLRTWAEVGAGVFGSSPEELVYDRAETSQWLYYRVVLVP